MYKIAVVACSDLALGFELAGVKVKINSNIEHAQQELDLIIKEKQIGIIIIEDILYNNLTSTMKKQLDESTFPIFFILPLELEKIKETMSKKFLIQSLQKMLGFKVENLIS